jgi:hypothetical protein
MEREKTETTEKLTEPWKFYRKLTPAGEQIIEEHLDELAGSN